MRPAASETSRRRLAVDRPCRLVRIPGLNSPVFAFSEISSDDPSPVPNTSCGGMPLVPGQYAMPRVDGVCPMSLTQISFPVSASSATTRLYIVAMYMTPSTTSGVDADCRGAGLAGAAGDSPRAGCGAGAAALLVRWRRRREGAGGTAAGVSYVHASWRFETLAVLICLSGEYRCAPASWPCIGQSLSGFGV